MAATETIRKTEGWVPNDATNRIFSRVDAEEFVGDIDWDEAARALNGPPIPPYVHSSIHGIEGGYSTSFAAATWDPVVRSIFQEYYGSEAETRDDAAADVTITPATILDVACGTGESTRSWRRRFPDASIDAFDVSPYMAAVAQRKVAGDDRIEVRALDAESMPFQDASFDLVTASLLFHELPVEPARRILGEMFRVVRPGGQVSVVEPYEVGGTALKPIPFPEPYLKEYLATDWTAAFEAAGFREVRARSNGNGWVRVGVKPA